MFRPLALATAAAVLAGCGPSIPQHNGYRANRNKPWKKAKVLKFDSSNRAEHDSTVNYRKRRRARWYKFELARFSELEITLTSSPLAADTEVDVAFEVLDSGFRVLMRADNSEDDAGEEKKKRTLYELAAGDYYVHVWVQERTAAADYTIKLESKPLGDQGEDDFPANVQFVDALAAVPPVDDAPPPVRTARRCKGKNCKKPKPQTQPKSSSIRARITSISKGDGSTRIKIGVGSNRGVERGWRGRVITSGGSAIPRGSFKVTKVTATSAYGSVKASSDSVTAAKYVRLRPP